MRPKYDNHKEWFASGKVSIQTKNKQQWVTTLRMLEAIGMCGDIDTYERKGKFIYLTADPEEEVDSIFIDKVPAPYNFASMEDFFAAPIPEEFYQEFELNYHYTAKITPSEVSVGCQSFDLNKVIELGKLAEEAKKHAKTS